MKHLGFIAIALIVLFSLLSLPTTVLATDDQGSLQDTFSIEVEACQLEFTDLGSKARFQITDFYEISTDDKGSVASLERIDTGGSLDRFIRVDHLKCCIDRWSLKPSFKYSLSLTAGTTAETLERWHMRLCEKAGNCIKIVLPRIRASCPEDDTAEEKSLHESILRVNDKIMNRQPPIEIGLNVSLKRIWEVLVVLSSTFQSPLGVGSGMTFAGYSEFRSAASNSRLPTIPVDCEEINAWWVSGRPTSQMR